MGLKDDSTYTCSAGGNEAVLDKSVDILCKERLNLVSGAVICLLRSLENCAKIVCFHWNYTQYYRLVSRTTQKIGAIEVSKP